MLEAMKQTTASGLPMPFRIGYLQADRHRKSGGQYRTIKCTLSKKGKKSGSIANRVINVQLHGTNDIHSVHYDAILYYNDSPVS